MQNEQIKSKGSRRGFLAVIAVMVILIPATIGISWYLGDRKYYIASVLIMIYSMIPFFVSFERRKPQARELVTLAVMCAIAVASRAIFIAVPHFKPMGAIVMITGMACAEIATVETTIPLTQPDSPVTITLTCDSALEVEFDEDAPAGTVSGKDKLRLLRLARLAAQTGFTPDEDCMRGAAQNAALIRDIVPERIFHEMQLLLTADAKCGDRLAPYRGLCILRDTGVFAYIFPELARGDKMAQRKDFHDHDVLEHTFRCVRYAPPAIRWAALLHDCGKPLCMLRDGNFYAHPAEGARIAEETLVRLKAPVRLTEETKTLVLLHMRDFNLQMREGKVRREIVHAYPLLEKLFALKQADYSACKDDLSPAPSVVKWKRI